MKSQDSKILSLRKVLEQVAAEHRASPEAIGLAWLIKLPSKPIPVLGSINLTRLDAMAKSQEFSITREEWFMLYQAALGHQVP